MVRTPIYHTRSGEGRLRVDAQLHSHGAIVLDVHLGYKADEKLLLALVQLLDTKLQEIRREIESVSRPVTLFDLIDLA